MDKELHSHFKLDVYQKLCTFAVYTFDDIAPSSIKFFNSSKVAEYINNELSSNKLVCEWETEGNALVICSSEEDIAQCCRIVESVEEVRFPLRSELAPVFVLSQWQENIT